MSNARGRSGGQCGRPAGVGGSGFVYDGPCCLVGTWSEQHRHVCEARRILSLPSREARKEWLAAIEKRRGVQARSALETTIRGIYRERNRVVPPRAD